MVIIKGLPDIQADLFDVIQYSRLYDVLFEPMLDSVGVF
jgi:hypothetical protein